MYSVIALYTQQIVLYRVTWPYDYIDKLMIIKEMHCIYGGIDTHITKKI